MNYRNVVKDLHSYPYPNLMAEFVESGYSICTLADHMGLGRRQEDDEEVWDKLNGRKDILADEAIGLCNLYGVKFKYLFAAELKEFNGQSAAFWRWYQENYERQREIEQHRRIEGIERRLRQDPELLVFFETLLSMNDNELGKIIEMIKAPAEDK